MVHATLEDSVSALLKAVNALESSLDDIQERIDQGYVKEMKGQELDNAFHSFSKVESILKHLSKIETRLGHVHKNFKHAVQ